MCWLAGWLALPYICDVGRVYGALVELNTGRDTCFSGTLFARKLCSWLEPGC